MRLIFTDWKMEGGMVTERHASCGPLDEVAALTRGGGE